MLMESDYLETILAFTNCRTTSSFLRNFRGLILITSVAPLFYFRLYLTKYYDRFYYKAFSSICTMSPDFSYTLLSFISINGSGASSAIFDGLEMIGRVRGVLIFSS